LLKIQYNSDIYLKVTVLIKIVLVFLLLCFDLFALDINSENKDIEILSKSKVLISDINADLKDISGRFQKLKNFEKKHFNIGFDTDVSVWVEINLYNSSNVDLRRVIEIDNPLLEEITFFEQENSMYKQKRGLLYISDEQQHINPFYTLNLPSHENKKIFIKILNRTTTLQFGIYLKDLKLYEKADKIKQFSIVLFLGIILSFILYSVLLYIYTKDFSYLLYSFYLVTLVFQQLTYIGFSPLYMPSWFVEIDNLLVVPKVSLMIIAAALFARAFLKTKEFKKIDFVYKSFIVIVILQMPFFGTQKFYVPEVTVIIGFLFIIFNTFSGVYIYLHGNKQARFFIVGWSFLIVGYLLMIFDSLGYISVMHKFPELILCITVLEALFLLLAFVDKINILTAQKNFLNSKLLKEMQSRQQIVEEEVRTRTDELKASLQERVVLFRELHHRVKNNLQLILSIIRLQKYNIKEESAYHEFLKLENRIQAIAKTHEILCESEDVAKVDMREYIQQLCEEIVNSTGFYDIDMVVKSDVSLSLRKAVYIGLIVNELVMNSIKHALDNKKGEKVFVSLYKEGEEYVLKLYDNNTTKTTKKESKNSLGLKLVDILVVNQLEGKISSENGFNYIINFR